jgi:hypothetical protein
MYWCLLNSVTEYANHKCTTFRSFFNTSCSIVQKVKDSRNRPGVAQRVPEGLGSQISWHSARGGGEVVSLTHRPPLPPGMFLVLVFTRGWVDPRAMVGSEENMSLKNPVTPPGIDPGTVRLVAQWQLHDIKIKKSVLSSDFAAKDKATGSHSFTATEFENIHYFPI